jgi:pimeloyl-ACP methyl ester carboxylesterase
MFDYVISARGIKQGKFTAEPGDVLYLKVPRSAKITAPSMKIDPKTWMDEVRDLADGVAGNNAMSTSDDGDVLMFVHGYNNGIDVVLQRQRQLQADLSAEGWRGIVVAFDWPSGNSTLNYLEDRGDAAAVAGQMVTHGIAPMAIGQLNGCKTNVHLLGHSTGAYVIVEAFAAAQKHGALFKTPWRVAQCAFIAGDVSAGSLAANSDWARPMYERVMRLTNYSNPFDQVLGVSNAKRLGTAPRAGRVGLPADLHSKSIDVNCGSYFQSLNPKTATYFGTFNHSWHIGNRVFARDLAMTLEGSIDRHALPTRATREGRLTLVTGQRPKFQKWWHMTGS